MKELLIDTCTQTLSLALTCDGDLVACELLSGFKNHAETIMVAVNDLIKQAKWQASDLNQIAVAYGPGSYTGIRIGVTLAKTLGYTLNIPVKCVSSLELLAWNLSFLDEAIVVPMINARRNNVYAGIYEIKKGKVFNLDSDKHQSLTLLQEKLVKYQNKQIILTGDAKIFDFDSSYQIIDSFMTYPQAFYLTKANGKVYQEEEIHMITPNYLKKVEAEEKWQQENPKAKLEANYIETLK